MPVLNLYVPATAATARVMIDPRSGIVGLPIADSDRVLVYYEGNRFNAQNMRRFDQRVHHAAGRMAAKYPTIAQAILEAADLQLVGTYDTDKQSITVTDSQTLNAWAGEVVEEGITRDAMQSQQYRKLIATLKVGRMN